MHFFILTLPCWKPQNGMMIVFGAQTIPRGQYTVAAEALVCRCPRGGGLIDHAAVQR
jgi:hypothetical protein